MNIINVQSTHSTSKAQHKFLFAVLGLFCLGLASSAFAATDLNHLTGHVSKQVASFGKIVLQIAWVSGFCFCMGGLYLLRQQRENPVQIHLNKPIFALGIGGALIFLTTVIGIVGKSTLDVNELPRYVHPYANPNHAGHGSQYLLTDN